MRRHDFCEAAMIFTLLFAFRTARPDNPAQR